MRGRPTANAVQGPFNDATIIVVLSSKYTISVPKLLESWNHHSIVIVKLGILQLYYTYTTDCAITAIYLKWIAKQMGYLQFPSHVLLLHA